MPSLFFVCCPLFGGSIGIPLQPGFLANFLDVEQGNDSFVELQG